MRLLKESDVIKAVDRHTRDDGTLDDDISVILEEVETGFDKEKVLEELEGLRSTYFLTIANTGDKKLDLVYQYVWNALDHAIGIVDEDGGRIMAQKIIVDREEYEEMVRGDKKDYYETLLSLVFSRQMELSALGLYTSKEYTYLEEIKIWLRRKIKKL